MTWIKASTTGCKNLSGLNIPYFINSKHIMHIELNLNRRNLAVEVSTIDGCRHYIFDANDYFNIPYSKLKGDDIEILLMKIISIMKDADNRNIETLDLQKSLDT